MAQAWKSGLFECFQDINICLLGWCCGCYLHGQNAEKLGEDTKIKACLKYGGLQMCGLCCLIHKPRRQRMRTTYGLEEKPSDFLATCCCSGCANCQEAREITARGAPSGGARAPVVSQPAKK
ncbi:unnamed protein product [Adineta steineri]|uniref:Uncharacterized protein n=1 Tax=Adineta steineri TaxID=433720 RepID=A0A814PSW6_9BILA|nr:unnamed protein product [Adineta steineri]CAF1060637.1 unnamed protein product [Adineta steineri]CAF1109972.1 unnamed protein product [Adineta steineri]